MDLKAANPLLMADESIPAFLRGDLSPDGSISFSVLRYLYAVTLLVMNPSQLRRFWESLPLERNGVRGIDHLRAACADLFDHWL